MACAQVSLSNWISALEFAQVMGVAERMDRRLRRRPELGVGFEAVVDDDAPFEAFGHRAAPGAGAVEREGFGGDRMQPLRFAADPQAVLSIVEGSSRQRTRAAHTSAPIRFVTGASAPAFPRVHSATLAAQRLSAPISSASASAARASGIKCCAWR